MQLGLISLNINGNTKLVQICVIREANAAPEAAKIGINSAFKAMLIIAADKYIYFKYFCLFSHTIHAFLATPKYENAVYHVTIRSGETAPMNSAPYKIRMINVANKENTIETNEDT